MPDGSKQIDKKLMEAAPAILEASSEAIATVNSTGAIVSFNSQFLSLMAVSAEQCRKLRINEIFREIGTLSILDEQKDEFEPVELIRPDGTNLWALIKILSVGSPADGYRTVLIHDPDTIRRIIDRLDYIENYDIGTGLLNRHKGIVEFEQMQASNLSGGCFLVKVDTGLVDGTNTQYLEDCLRLVARIFRQIEEQSIACRLSSTDFLFVYTAEQPISIDTYAEIADRLKNEPAILDDTPLWISYLEWSASEVPINSLLDKLKDELTSIHDPNLLTDLRSHRRTDSVRSLNEELREALNSGELDFYIQPQIDSETRQVVGGELLVRWLPTPGAVVTPARFIEYLEQGEFAKPFYHWSIRRSVEILRYLHDELGMWMPLSLNLAISHFIDNEALQELVDIVRDNEIPNKMLELEITERVFAENPQAVLENLNMLQSEGFKIAIDDFGTGYSSLSYLRRFPLDRLKIDRVFVSNIVENEEDRLIVTAIMSLAHVLGMEVVAEGVETAFQSSFLRDIGCEYFQGYLPGKPMAVEDFLEFSRNNPQHSRWEDIPTKVLKDRDIGRKIRKVTWKKSFSTDIVSIDNEHRSLIDALNHFTAQYLDDPESVDFVSTIDAIASEAIKHFEHEEEVMYNIKYPRYEAHREKHEWLIADIAKRKTDIANSRQSANVDEILQYLKYWLLRHLVSEDTHLHRYLNKPMSERRH